MFKDVAVTLWLALVLAACSNDPAAPAVSAQTPELAQQTSQGLEVRSIPDEDPGPPFYARVGVQFLTDGELLAIPFYRPAGCIPPDFNLLDFFHFPGPGGPGAFGCPLLMTGKLLIEPDAPLGTFPRRVVLEDAGAVPFWFVPYAAFESATQDGELTVSELSALDPLIGTADRYHETLHPREGEHKIIIAAKGTLADGRSFRFHATHLRDELRSIRISIR